MAKSTRKIFQIGFNRCGTLSLFELFSRSGVPSIHWDNGMLAKTIAANIANGRDPIAGYEWATFFSDMEYIDHESRIESFKSFKDFHRFHKDALFILNTRCCAKWLKSRLSHPELLNYHKSHYGTDNTNEIIFHWRRDWHSHHNEVLTYFLDFPSQLLVFDIEHDNPDALVEFAGPSYGLDANHFGHANSSSDREKYHSWRRMISRQIRRTLERFVG